jgi:hypothetical protein
MPSPIQNERAIVAQLSAQGFDVEANDALETLRLLAAQGHVLRHRYLNSCNYEWACTEAYDARTEALQEQARVSAKRAGLHIYFQTDPRGACVYVSPQPIPRNAYSTHAICLFPAER